MIKSTHVGSLPRPAAMIAQQLRKEQITDTDLRGYLRELIDRQLSIGLNIINNGELPRLDYISSTVFEVVSITPGIRILSSGSGLLANTSYSWA